jgi:hypothetical protein
MDVSVVVFRGQRAITQANTNINVKRQDFDQTPENRKFYFFKRKKEKKRALKGSMEECTLLKRKVQSEKDRKQK